MATVSKLSPGLWQISLPFQGEDEVVGSYLLEGKGELAIIDPGPETTAKALLSSIREAGFNPEDVTHILITHIHLDHAGATGTLLQKMPKAQVYVHHIGAPHLADPAKLIASATRIFGERMVELWGKIEPVPADRIKAIDGGDVLNLVGRRIEVHYTPGHAIHHVVYYDVHTGEMFVGDIAGIHLPSVSYVRPPTPAPDLDVNAWFNSIDLMKKLRPDILYLAHYSAVDKPIHHLERLRASILTWGDYILSAIRDGKNEAEIVQTLKAQTEPELLRITGDQKIIRKYDLTCTYEMNVQGFVRYWQKNHPEPTSN